MLALASADEKPGVFIEDMSSMLDRRYYAVRVIPLHKESGMFSRRETVLPPTDTSTRASELEFSYIRPKSGEQHKIPSDLGVGLFSSRAFHIDLSPKEIKSHFTVNALTPTIKLPVDTVRENLDLIRWTGDHGWCLAFVLYSSGLSLYPGAVGTQKGWIEEVLWTSEKHIGEEDFLRYLNSATRIRLGRNGEEVSRRVTGK